MLLPSDSEGYEYEKGEYTPRWRPRSWARCLRGRRRHVLFLCILILVTIVYRLSRDHDDGVVAMSDAELMRKYGIKNIKDLAYSKRDISSKIDAPFQVGCREIDNSGPRASAAFVVLARNSELDDVTKSMVSLERHFNQWFKYPWVFLNNEEFTDEFKSVVKQFTDAEVEFGVIPKKDWDFPPDVDPDEFKEFIESQGDRMIYYGNKESYHKMCRFFSGAFYKHELVKKRDWYWRVEPNVEFFCDLTYDPFVEMEKHNKKYGFNVMIHELYYTVPGLFRETKAFVKENKIQPNKLWRMLVKNFRYTKGKNYEDFDMVKDRKAVLKKIEEDLSLEKFLNKKGKKDLSDINEDLFAKFLGKAIEPPMLHEDRFDYEEYNLCHFWSNFEIARTDLFTSELYMKYFDRLEKSGGFYKERWGDAPVHSLALSMMLDIDEVHYFRDIGYKHSTLGHCPGNSKTNQLPYIPDESVSNNGNFQLYKPNAPVVNGVGCRCKCPLFHKEIEDSKSSCLRQWVRTTRDDYAPYTPIDLDFNRHKVERKLNKFLKKGGKLGDSDVTNDITKPQVIGK